MCNKVICMSVHLSIHPFNCLSSTVIVAIKSKRQAAYNLDKLSVNHGAYRQLFTLRPSSYQLIYFVVKYVFS